MITLFNYSHLKNKINVSSLAKNFVDNIKKRDVSKFLYIGYSLFEKRNGSFVLIKQKLIIFDINTIYDELIDGVTDLNGIFLLRFTFLNLNESLNTNPNNIKIRFMKSNNRVWGVQMLPTCDYKSYKDDIVLINEREDKGYYTFHYMDEFQKVYSVHGAFVENYYHNIVKVYSRKYKLLFKYTDICYKNNKDIINFGTFTRTFTNKTFIFEDGELMYKFDNKACIDIKKF